MDRCALFNRDSNILVYCYGSMDLRSITLVSSVHVRENIERPLMQTRAREINFIANGDGIGFLYNLAVLHFALAHVDWTVSVAGRATAGQIQLNCFAVTS